ncbi:hypothetical protein MUY21_07775 [Aliiroseovarius sp. S2029]|uniref:hypothetical protein n=1 Tax=Aliiroseovarius sp. S2029 TaxID=2936988 RepID=UPI0020C08C38|nr:hypothetical protein [Aliiroseovarius sp. S2029]MCK8483932.1 hypothetical protein [Aliiroseovarius sp. S2029]
MTWSIDPPIQVGGYACAAVVEVDFSVRPFAGMLAGHGDKRPLLLLLLRDGVVRGFDLNGQVFQRDEIENLFPDAIVRMKNLLSDTI